MGNSFDWIVVGAGITGAALGYELAKLGGSVLLLEQHATPQSATRFSYGGLAYWAGTTDLTRKLFAEGLELHRQLSDELEAATDFRELDLLLAVLPDADLAAALAGFQDCAIQPESLTPQQAKELEPLLDQSAIASCLRLPHAQIHPQATVDAFRAALVRLGGTLQLAQVRSLLWHKGNELAPPRVMGVECRNGDRFYGAQVVICAGALSRQLLAQSGIQVPLYFTHAELLETPPLPEIALRTMVMEVHSRRFDLEAEATRAEVERLWDEPGHELAPPILDSGAVQFSDGQLRIGQMSRTLTTPQATTSSQASEAQIRAEIARVLPVLQTVPGTWCSCLVAFTRDRLPLIGPIAPAIYSGPQNQNTQDQSSQDQNSELASAIVAESAAVQIFSGFSSPLAIVPLLARKFAAHLYGQKDPEIQQLSPQRFQL